MAALRVMRGAPEGVNRQGYPLTLASLLGLTACSDDPADAAGDLTDAGNLSDYRGPATAWLHLHLMNDESARDLFYGKSCGLCGDAKWQVQRKNLD